MEGPINCRHGMTKSLLACTVDDKHLILATPTLKEYKKGVPHYLI